MFSFFSRKSGSRPPPPEEPSFSESVPESQQHLTPFEEPPAAGPPPTPSPAPEDLPNNSEAQSELHTIASLRALIQFIPAPTLHRYTLDTLSTLSTDPSDANATSTSINPIPVLQFFQHLSPPPQLHCVRCHSGYYDVENTDRSCLIGHDDDCAEVTRVKRSGFSELETLWTCCGRTVEGDGDQGPPDGWCYEGKHTTDVKRARYRADATPHDDKLKSCAEQRCFDFSPSALRKRRREADYDSDDSRHMGDDQDETKSVSASTRGARSRAKPSSTSASGRGRPSRRAGTPSEASASAKPKSTRKRAPKKAKLDEDDQEAPEEVAMAVDEQSSPQEKKPRRGRPKSKATISAEDDVEMDEMLVQTEPGSPSTSPAKKPRKPRASKAKTVPPPEDASPPPVPPVPHSAKKSRKSADAAIQDTTALPRAPSVPPTPGGSIKARMKPKGVKKGPVKGRGYGALSGQEDEVFTSDADSSADQPRSRRRRSSVIDPRKVKSTERVDAVASHSRAVNSAQATPLRTRKLSEVVSSSVPGEVGMTGMK